MNPTLFASIVTAGISYDSHESDLYIPDTPEARAILDRFPLEKGNARRFRSNTGRQWLDVPFAFLPFWEARAQGVTPPQS